MIAAQDVGLNERLFQAGPEGGRGEKIIDPPSDVPRPGAAHRAPPGVMAAALFKFPKSIGKPRIHKGREAVALLDRETMIRTFALGLARSISV